MRENEGEYTVMSMEFIDELIDRKIISENNDVQLNSEETSKPQTYLQSSLPTIGPPPQKSIHLYSST